MPIVIDSKRLNQKIIYYDNWRLLPNLSHWARKSLRFVVPKDCRDRFDKSSYIVTSEDEAIEYLKLCGYILKTLDELSFLRNDLSVIAELSRSEILLSDGSIISSKNYRCISLMNLLEHFKKVNKFSKNCYKLNKFKDDEDFLKFVFCHDRTYGEVMSLAEEYNLDVSRIYRIRTYYGKENLTIKQAVDYLLDLDSKQMSQSRGRKREERFKRQY